ncbi:16299_t:CDS:2 [Funneliformis geosporum]|uniref:9240_t:CDS:1 n=1 Tax=Funneliformis geosporum TaxID=1117311 RepID=A0A9W4SXC8_9GLOM|nr:16299_t:CDS:2 [Funneliformis geosporum]CAI2182483.1 9240_t:CDS:2 [Funneliformis geosporum]
MSQKTVIFNVGGTTFEITKDLFNAHPKSTLFKLVNPSSSSEVVELQLREFGLDDDINLIVPDQSVAKVFGDAKRDEKDGVLEAKGDNNVLPSYEQALSGFSASYNLNPDKKRSENDGTALKDDVMISTLRRIDTLVSDVILPYLKRHAKRGHHQVTFYLTPHNVTSKNITTELENINNPHEWIHLPIDSSTLERNDDLGNDLPDLKFLLQKMDTLDQIQDFIISKSGAKKCTVNKIEVSCRSENEFGLYSSKSWDIVQIFVVIV